MSRDKWKVKMVIMDSQSPHYIQVYSTGLKLQFSSIYLHIKLIWRSNLGKKSLNACSKSRFFLSGLGIGKNESLFDVLILMLNLNEGNASICEKLHNDCVYAVSTKSTGWETFCKG